MQPFAVPQGCIWDPCRPGPVLCRKVACSRHDDKGAKPTTSSPSRKPFPVHNNQPPPTAPMSTTSPSVAATVTALLALTTPFVAPPGCPRFTTTSIPDTTSIDGVAGILVADDPSCHPDGWANVVPESRMRFSPGVCPSGWVYYNLREVEETDKFAAACCDRYAPLLSPPSRMIQRSLADNRLQWIRPYQLWLYF